MPRYLEEPHPDIKMSDWINSWIEEVAEPELSETTCDRYRRVKRLQLDPHIGEIALKDLAPRHVRRMQQRLRAEKRKPRTINLARAVLSGACRYACELELIEHNPVKSVAGPKKDKKKVIPPNVKAVKEILNAAKEFELAFHVFLHVLVYTGLRRGEAIALRWHNVHLNEAYIDVMESAVAVPRRGMVVQTPKTPDGTRRVDLDARTVRVMEDHRAELGERRDSMELVFPGVKGRLMTPSTLSRNLKSVGEKVGCPDITFHKFRHFHATVALHGNTTMAVVSHRLGHANIQTTVDLYGHPMEGGQKRGG